MAKINVYDFVSMFYQAKEITVHGWYNENGMEKCIHKTYTDKRDHEIFQLFRNYEVIQYKVTKKNCIDIIATNF